MYCIYLATEHLRLLGIALGVAISLLELVLTVYSGLGDSDAAVVSFTHPSIHPEDFARLLDAKGIAVRTGHHCAQPLMSRLGISGTIRASFYLYNDQSDADDVLEVTKLIVELKS